MADKFKLEEPFSDKEIKVSQTIEEESVEDSSKITPEILEERELPIIEIERPQQINEFAILQNIQGTQVNKNIRATNRLQEIKASTPLGDDKEILIQTGTAGWGFAMIGDNQEYGQFVWTSAGVVTLVNNSANTVAADTDAKFCIYDAGSGIAIKNRLGSTLTLRYELNYS